MSNKDGSYLWLSSSRNDRCMGKIGFSNGMMQFINCSIPFPTTNGLHIVSSGCGSGKSTMILEIIKEKWSKGVLVVVATIEAAEEFGRKIEEWIGGVSSFHRPKFMVLHSGTNRIAEMGIGILLCLFVHSRYNKMNHSVCLDCFAIAALVLTFYLFDASENYDKYVFLTFPLIIFAGMQSRSFLHVLFGYKIWLKLGGVTWEMYLIHLVLGNAFCYILEILGSTWNIYTFIVYAVFVTLAAFIFKAGCQKLQYKLFQHKD